MTSVILVSKDSMRFMSSGCMLGVRSPRNRACGRASIRSLVGFFFGRKPAGNSTLSRSKWMERIIQFRKSIESPHRSVTDLDHIPAPAAKNLKRMVSPTDSVKAAKIPYLEFFWKATCMWRKTANSCVANIS
eukprot:scaffold6436_cov158-Amphora_coffeaeformis.AAC.5